MITDGPVEWGEVTLGAYKPMTEVDTTAGDCALL